MPARLPRRLALAAAAVGLIGIGLEAQGPPAGRPVPAPAARHDTSPALRTLPPLAVDRAARSPHAPKILRQLLRAGKTGDPVVQSAPSILALDPPGVSFDGVANSDNVLAVLPPDTNGDVGPNHYVQWVNLQFAIYDRNGATLYGPAAGNTIWTGFGGPCATRNDGDPIVLYDEAADRWFLSQFALPNRNGLGLPIAPYYQCIAVSATPDPTGAYHRYVYSFNKLNDYPKFGVWPDAYYMTINQFTPFLFTFLWGGQGVAAFDRAAMLAGQPATMVFFDLLATDSLLGGMLPADVDGPAPPPGSPGYFVEVDDDAQGFPQDQIQLWEFDVDWTTPTNSTFTRKTLLPTAPFDSNLCAYARNCIPQPGTASRLDAIADRLMYRAAYRNFGTHESLVLNHTVDVNGADLAGIRWYELRGLGGTPVIHQQGTFSPDSTHRWMASAAMDASGNIALAYNTSSSTSSPSIRYTARCAADPPGQMTLGEADLFVGSGSQLSATSRWGDYSSLSIDPTNGSGFWAALEYYAATSGASWRTRVTAFSLASSCGGAPEPPAAPTNLQANAGSSTLVDLSWTDNADDEDGFRVERCLGAACNDFAQIAEVAANSTAYADMSVSGGNDYRYRVRAFNGGGNSEYSNIASASTPPAPQPPAAPTNLQGSAASATLVNLSWTDNAGDETGFSVERCTGAFCLNFAEIAQVAANVTVYADGTVAGDTSYRYRVRAFNGNGDSDYSNAVTVTTPAPPAPPSAPTGLTASAQGPRIRLNWTDTSASETRFEIQRRVTSGGAYAPLVTLPPNTTEYRDDTVTRRVDYTYQVRACNAQGCSAWSNEATAQSK